MHFKFNKLTLVWILLLFCTLPFVATAAVQATSQEANQLLTRPAIEKQLGRKMTFKEKLVFSLFKKKINKIYASDQQLQKADRDGYGMAVTSFILGVLNLLFLFLISAIVGFILAVLSVVFAAIAMRRIRRVSETREGKGLAIAGLVLGVVGVALFTAVILILIAEV